MHTPQIRGDCALRARDKTSTNTISEKQVDVCALGRLEIPARITQPCFFCKTAEGGQGASTGRKGLTLLLTSDRDCLTVVPMVLRALKILAGPP